MHSQLANTATPSELAGAHTSSLQVSGSTAEMHLCLPYSMVEPIRDILYSSMQSDHLVSDKRWIGTLTRQLQTAEVELVAMLGRSQITLGQILNLKAGDVIPFNVEETISAEVDHVPVMECRYGLQNGQYALKVERFITPDGADRR